MQEIRCPKCGEVFSVDESGYSAIVKQVHDKEFNAEIKRREESFEKEKKSAVKIAEAEKEKTITELKSEIQRIKSENEIAIQAINSEKEKIADEREAAIKIAVTAAESEKEKTITELKSEIQRIESEKEIAIQAINSEKEKIVDEREAAIKIAVTVAESEKEKTITELKSEIQKISLEKEIAIQNVNSKNEKTLSEKDQEIAKLNNTISTNKFESETTVRIAVAEKEKEIERLKAEKATAENNYKTEIDLLKDSHNKEIKDKNELIDYYKDLKTKMSTKMIGESLERHCQTEFDKIRVTAFPNCKFGKDNDIKTGSKGDFIFRDYSDGIEYISIMFEMKNENDTTATKRKNEDFFKELDKDRREKNCEYAVLVSLLESDNELYNEGIVNVSYKYPKMYVIRPQFFIPLISLLTNASQNAIEYKRQLTIMQNQNTDIKNFEIKLHDFKEKFGNNYRLASEKFQNAIDEIDKTIDHLQKVKEGLIGSERQLRLANDKAQDLSVKKLAKDSPSIIAMID